MFFLESISSACNDPALMSVLAVVKRILSVIQIIGPILALVSLSIHIVMMVMNPDNKKGFAKIRNSAIALVVLFIIPVIVNATFSLLDESTVISSCWNHADISYNTKENYISSDGKEDNRTQIIPDQSDYQKGSKKSGSSQSGSTKSNSSTGDRQGDGNMAASRVVFIGDSRTVQMYATLNNNWNGANYSSGGVHVVKNDVYVAEGAMGLSWMKNTGIPAAQSYFTSGTAIVILMGVNDLYNADNYISYINANVDQWKRNGSSLYFVSTNPCNGSYAHLNSSIQSFNAKLKKGLSSQVGWIDTYSELIRVGFKTTDGLHYDSATYRTIYNYIKSKV